MDEQRLRDNQEGLSESHWCTDPDLSHPSLLEFEYDSFGPESIVFNNHPSVEEQEEKGSFTTSGDGIAFSDRKRQASFPSDLQSETPAVAPDSAANHRETRSESAAAATISLVPSEDLETCGQLMSLSLVDPGLTDKLAPHFESGIKNGGYGISSGSGQHEEEEDERTDSNSNVHKQKHHSVSQHHSSGSAAGGNMPDANNGSVLNNGPEKECSISSSSHHEHEDDVEKKKEEVRIPDRVITNHDASRREQEEEEEVKDDEMNKAINNQPDLDSTPSDLSSITLEQRVTSAAGSEEWDRLNSLPASSSSLSSSSSPSSPPPESYCSSRSSNSTERDDVIIGTPISFSRSSTLSKSQKRKISPKLRFEDILNSSDDVEPIILPSDSKDGVISISATDITMIREGLSTLCESEHHSDLDSQHNGMNHYLSNNRSGAGSGLSRDSSSNSLKNGSEG